MIRPLSRFTVTILESDVIFAVAVTSLREPSAATPTMRKL
jgi:hypothetical protein